MRLLLRLVVAAGLAVDGYVHVDLAAAYEGIGTTLTQATLFRIEAGAAGAAALLVIALGRRWAFGFAFMVAASAFAAVMLYRYVDVGGFGPVPNMYEPLWSPEKLASAVAEAAAALAALAGVALGRRSSPTAAKRPRHSTPAVSDSRSRDEAP
ncbi:MAG: hypothetical protein ACRDMV_13455 [Streptosporangiales bacterium]